MIPYGSVQEYDVDVLVIGSGAAGLRAAIAARDTGASVLLLSKATAGLGTATLLSYGAFASAGLEQSAEEHAQRTLKAGYYRNNAQLVKILSEEAPTRISELIHRGLELTKGRYGFMTKGKFPIVGKSIIETLLAWARTSGVRIVSWITAVSLIADDAKVLGSLGITANGKAVIIRSKAVVLCTGGASALYKFHDNPSGNIGDGYAMARQCGAEVADMEFVQFYPLLITSANLPKIIVPASLIEKGEIINDAGEDIVEKYALSGVRPLAIRGRDRLSTALFKENIQGRKAYLDIGRVRVDDSSLESSDREMLRVLEDRYQSATRRLPVMPCAHFTIGGVVIDEHCRTSREGLFAAGEVACGLHGANRMGGNALTETLVFGCRAGNRAAVFSADSRPDKPYKVDVRHMLERMGNDAAGRHLPASALKSIRQIMWENCGPVRDSTGLSLALDRVRKLKEEGIRCESPRDLGLAYSVGNCLDTAIMVIKGAIERKASMGAHRPGVDCAPQSGPRGR